MCSHELCSHELCRETLFVLSGQSGPIPLVPIVGQDTANRAATERRASAMHYRTTK